MASFGQERSSFSMRTLPMKPVAPVTRMCWLAYQSVTEGFFIWKLEKKGWFLGVPEFVVICSKWSTTGICKRLVRCIHVFLRLVTFEFLVS